MPGLRTPRLTFLVAPINQLDKSALTSLNGSFCHYKGFRDGLFMTALGHNNMKNYFVSNQLGAD